MAILRVKDANGNVHAIPAIKGDKGDPGYSGVIVGSYVGDGATLSRYIDLGVSNVVAVVICVGDITSESPQTAIVTKSAVLLHNGSSTAAIIENGPYPNSALGLYQTSANGASIYNQPDVTYNYIAFVGGEETA